jgi:hypothetical protein
MEFLILSGAVLCLTISVALFSNMMHEMLGRFDQSNKRWALAQELRESKKEVKNLKSELDLWKIACDKLHKEMENGNTPQEK